MITSTDVFEIIRIIIPHHVAMFLVPTRMEMKLLVIYIDLLTFTHGRI